MTPQASVTDSRTSRRAVGAKVSSLFDEHSAMVLGLCRLLLRDHHEAEDACQQTFVSAYRALLRGTEPREAGPWLAAIARNECRARLRKRMRAPIALDDDMEIADTSNTDLAEVADRRAEIDLLATEIAKLPSRQREAIALRDFLGLSYEEVASVLSVSVPVVESLLFRARRRLRDTVHRVPRYAAGFLVVPLALRASVARDIPDFDAAIGGTVAAGAGAAGLAKLLSLPFSMKAAATTVAIVAAGSVVAPKLIDHPTRHLRAAATVTAAAGAPADPKPVASPAAASAPVPAAADAPDAPSVSAGAPAAADDSSVEASTQAPSTAEPTRVSSSLDDPAQMAATPQPDPAAATPCPDDSPLDDAATQQMPGSCEQGPQDPAVETPAAEPADLSTTPEPEPAFVPAAGDQGAWAPGGADGDTPEPPDDDGDDGDGTSGSGGFEPGKD